MTETLSHIALRRLNGSDASDWYTPFDSVRVGLTAEGCLTIDAPAVCDDVLVTNDIAQLSSDGSRFRILGRKDNVIDSGGIKIQAEEVERLLRPHLPVPFIVTSVPDPKFCEAVVLLHEPIQMSDDDIKEICIRVLPPYWPPRYYLEIPSLPLTETGKPARKRARDYAKCSLVHDGK